MHPTITRALQRDDPYTRYWALNWGVRGQPPEDWVHRAIAVARADDTLLEPLYSALGPVPWSTLRGPLASVLFDSTAPAELRCLLWIFWAHNETDVPDLPGDPEFVTRYELLDQPRAERILAERGVWDDDPERAFEGLCVDPDTPLPLILSWMQRLDVDLLEYGFRELVGPFGLPRTHDLPDRSIVDRLPESLQLRARALLEGFASPAIDDSFTDRLLLRIATYVHHKSLPPEELLREIVDVGSPDPHQIEWLNAAIASDAHAVALATAAAPDLAPRALLELFAHRIPEPLAALLVTHWTDRHSPQSMVEPLKGAPEVLRAIARPLLLGPNASDILAALAYADPAWAVPLLLEVGEEVLAGMENDNPFWNALVGLGDLRAVSFVQSRFLPHHLTRGWAWQTLAGLHDEPVPRLDLPDPEARIIEHPTILRVACTACGRWTTHAVSGATIVPVESVTSHFDVPDDWDGVTPNEILVCPGCGVSDQYRVADHGYEELLLCATRRTLSNPNRQHRLGLSARPRIFAGELATRPSTAEADLQRRLTTEDTPRVWEGWLQYLYLTTQDERLVQEGRRAVERWPASGDLHWYLALGAELTGAFDVAVEAARVGVLRCTQRGPVDDCLGVLEQRAGVRFLDVAWRWEGRTLRGSLDLGDLDAAAFLAALDRVEVVPGDDGPPGWVDRWMRGERPASRDDKRAEARRKKAARKKQKSRRKR